MLFSIYRSFFAILSTRIPIAVCKYGLMEIFVDSAFVYIGQGSCGGSKPPPYGMYTFFAIL